MSTNNINFTDEILAYNINFLTEIKKGTFKFDKEGKIHKLRFLEKFFLNTSQLANAKKTFNQFTKAIHVNNNVMGLREKDIKKFFFETISPLDRDLYKRELDPAVFKLLKKEMEFKEGISKTVSCWAKLGSFIASDDGCGASVRIVEGGKNKKPLGIFKAAVGEPLGEKNTKLAQRIKKFVLRWLVPKSMVGSLFETSAGQGYVA